MTYNISYLAKNEPESSLGYSLFDIEYYLKDAEATDGRGMTYSTGLWFSEISVLPIVEGLVRFLKDKFDEGGFDHMDFIKDADEIQELRGLLYEWENNRPKEKMAAINYHYDDFGVKLENKLNEFAKKWGLYVSRD